MNLYQKIGAKPPTKDTLANRLLGSRSVYTGVAVPVRRPDAAQMWRTTDVVHSQPNIHVPYTLGAGMGGKGGLAGLARLAGLGSFQLTFNHVWSAEDLFGEGGARTANWRAQNREQHGLDWSPISRELAKQASDAHTLVQDVASSSSTVAVQAQQLLARWASDLQKAIADVDETWDYVYAFKENRPLEYESRRVAGLRKIKNTLEDMVAQGQALQNAIAAERAAQSTALTQGAGGGGFVPGSTSSINSNRNLVTTGTTKPAGGLNIPLILGGAAVLVVGIIVVKKMRK